MRLARFSDFVCILLLCSQHAIPISIEPRKKDPSETLSWLSELITMMSYPSFSKTDAAAMFGNVKNNLGNGKIKVVPHSKHFSEVMIQEVESLNDSCGGMLIVNLGLSESEKITVADLQKVSGPWKKLPPALEALSDVSKLAHYRRFPFGQAVIMIRAFAELDRTGARVTKLSLDRETCRLLDFPGSPEF